MSAIPNDLGFVDIDALLNGLEDTVRKLG